MDGDRGQVISIFRAEDASREFADRLGDRFISTGRFYIASHDNQGELLGHASFCDTLFQGHWLLTIEVEASHRRRGIGAELLRSVVEFTEKSGREIRFEATNNSGPFWATMAERLVLDLQQEIRSERFGKPTTFAGKMRFVNPLGKLTSL